MVDPIGAKICDAFHSMPLTAPSPISTPRLVIRHFEPADLDDLLAINGDPEVTRYLPYDTWKDADAARAWYERMRKLEEGGGTVQLVIARAGDGLVIGTALLFMYDEGSARAELGYVLRRDHWGGGWMREALTALIDHAFGPMGLRRLEAGVNPANVASDALLVRLGFEREGVRRERWITKGRPEDSATYGLLARDWARLRAG
jgi:[ribosomal protein S5]-alanine N-acetyltransferase